MLAQNFIPCASELHRIPRAEFNRRNLAHKAQALNRDRSILGAVNTACAPSKREATLNLTQAVWFKFYFAAAGYPYSKSDAHCIDEISPSCFSYAAY